MPAALVSVIGPPASGKTCLASHLAQVLPAQLVREDFAGNPFLSEAYLGRADLALPSQLFFLFSRVRQLSLRHWPAGGVVVTDYGFCQDGAYAEQVLNADDLATYRRLAAPAGGAVKPPDLVVCLDGSEALLLERIARRGRRHERVFTARFLSAMREAYRRLSAGLGCRVLTIDIDRDDLFVPEVMARWVEQVRACLQDGPPRTDPSE